MELEAARAPLHWQNESQLGWTIGHLQGDATWKGHWVAAEHFDAMIRMLAGVTRSRPLYVASPSWGEPLELPRAGAA